VATEHQKKEPSSLRSLVETFLAKKLAAPELNYEQKIAKIWLRVVGKDIGKHAEPTGFRNGTLFVRVSHPLWSTELQYRSADIKQKLNEILEDTLVEEIRFRS
jgi:predicted nucleic acid-binding Zn ribbon protein